MFAVTNGNLRDKFITLVSSIDSKVNEKIARARTELTENIGQLDEVLQQQAEAIQQIQEALETLESTEHHQTDIQNLNAQVNGIEDTLVNSTIRVLSDAQLAQLELKTTDKLVYLKISDLTIYSRELVNDNLVDTPIGRLTAIEPSL